MMMMMMMMMFDNSPVERQQNRAQWSAQPTSVRRRRQTCIAWARPTATWGITCMVCLCVGHDREPCETDEPIEMSFRGRLVWAWGTVY